MTTAFDAQTFRQVMGHVPTSIAVVTGLGDRGQPCGLAVGSFVSISLDPPLVGFFAGEGSRSWPQIRPHGSFCVNVLHEDQAGISAVFASRREDKFAEVDWFTGPDGVPVLAEAQVSVHCRLDSESQLGDHNLVVGRVQQMEHTSARSPLVFFQSGYHSVSPVMATT